MKFRESGAASCREYGSTCLEDVEIDRSPKTVFLENCPGLRWSRSQRILAATFGTKLVARRVQERSSYHNAISGADFAAQPCYVAIVETLSEQQFVDCDTTDSGCNEGWMDNAFSFAKTNSICTKGSYPYTATDGTCNLSGCQVGIPQGGVVGYTDVSTDSEQAMMSAEA